MEEFFKNNPNIFNNNQSNPNRHIHKTKSQNCINNKNNNDNSNNNYPPFMVAKFGKKKVISQDLATFLNSIKKAEWTNNPSYLIVKDIEVKPTFNNDTELNNELSIPKYSNTINKLYLHLNKVNIGDYLNYTNEVNDRQNKIGEFVKREKDAFIKSNFGYTENKIDMNIILDKIRSDYLGFISKDQILYNKINQAIN